MRPRHDAGENLAHPAVEPLLSVASMRPRHDAGENAAAAEARRIEVIRFNEAPA